MEKVNKKYKKRRPFSETLFMKIEKRNIQWIYNYFGGLMIYYISKYLKIIGELQNLG